MKIHILCTDGSPLGVTLKDLWGKGNRGIGLGGSEYALLTLCEEWHKRGDEVVLFNNPTTPDGSPFEQRRIAEYDPNEKRDVLIIFRSPNDRSVITTNCLKVWWSCDQQTIGDFTRFSSTVDKIVCISPRHAHFFKDIYGIKNTTVIDIPVRMDDYDSIEKPERIKNRLIFTSVPARGLDNLWRIYPIIQKEIPDVSLAITSDYRLWGVGASNEHFRSRWLSRSNVLFFGALPRERYILEQLKAQILLYPSNYDELFCVAVSESQYAGVYPITSNTGALPTTNMGTVLSLNADDPHNDRAYADATISLLNDAVGLERAQRAVHQLAKERFNPQKILARWDSEVFK